MSWLGKITGGAFGFLVGGPLGAAFGVALGHQLDQATFDLKAHQAGLSPEEAERLHQTYLSALFMTLGCVAKSDGRVSPKEIACARDIMARMQLKGPDLEFAMRLFNEGKQPRYMMGPKLNELYEIAGSRLLLLRFFMAVQTEMALADGKLSESKAQLLLDICDGLHFSRYEFFGLRTRVEARRRFGGFGTQSQRGNGGFRKESSGAWEQHQPCPLNATGPLEEAYRMLSISQGASESDVKRAYRRAISQNHPDKVAAKGLSAREVQKATEMTQKIQNAYETICRHQGMRS